MPPISVQFLPGCSVEGDKDFVTKVKSVLKFSGVRLIIGFHHINDYTLGITGNINNVAFHSSQNQKLSFFFADRINQQIIRILEVR